MIELPLGESRLRDNVERDRSIAEVEAFHDRLVAHLCRSVAVRQIPRPLCERCTARSLAGDACSFLAHGRAERPSCWILKADAGSLSGRRWCGDCINQCPVFDHFAKASGQIDLRFLDRDAKPEIRSALAINGGHRVPVLVFLSEDWFEVSRYGERPLSTYRRMAAEQLGPACPTGLLPPPEEAMRALTTDWLDEFERSQLILRLSPRLRGMHGD